MAVYVYKATHRFRSDTHIAQNCREVHEKGEGVASSSTT